MTRCALLLVLTLGAAPASAQERWYLGVRGGLAQAGQDGGGLSQSLAERGHAVSADVDTEDVGGMLYGGYFVSPRIALEVGVGHLGRYDASVTGVPDNPGQLAADLTVLQQPSGWTGSMAARGAWRLAPRTSFTPRLGAFHWRRDSTITVGQVRADVTLSGFGLLAGAGVVREFAAGWRVGIGWDYYQPEGDPGIQHVYANLEFAPQPALPEIAQVPAATPAPIVVARREPAAAVPAPVAQASELRFGAIRFAARRATLDPADTTALARIAAELRAVQSIDPEVRIELAGHADGDGHAAANLRLSAQRVEWVKAYLVERGVDGRRIAAAAHGNDDPEQDASNFAGRGRNRRVEVRAVLPAAAAIEYAAALQ